MSDKVHRISQYVKEVRASNGSNQSRAAKLPPNGSEKKISENDTDFVVITRINVNGVQFRMTDFREQTLSLNVFKGRKPPVHGQYSGTDSKKADRS